MRPVGLTGGIGAGKSTVATRFAELGAIIIDSDVLAREVVAAGTPGFQQVLTAFGPDIVDPDGELDRQRLASLVFADPTLREQLNAIVHPLVRARAQQLTKQADVGDHFLVIHDVPLLVENDLAKGFAAVIVVECPLNLRIERLRKRGMTLEQIEARMRTQVSDEARRKVADYLIVNDGTLLDLFKNVDTIWHSLRTNLTG